MAFDFGKMAKDAARAVGQVATSAAEAAGPALKEGAQKAADIAVSGAATVIDIADSAIRDANERKYTPLFVDEYLSSDFDRPKLIVVSDEDERKGIETCVGAIGWMRRDLLPEVMHMYEEFVPKSGLSFYPRAICDAAYIIDPFDNTRYIDQSQFLNVARRDQMTELKQIAHMLGAKECRLEYSEETLAGMTVSESVGGSGKTPISGVSRATASLGVEQKGKREQKTQAHESILFYQEFEGGVSPSMPKLKWYKDDNEILDLIHTRLDADKNTTKSYRVEINSFASMCMSSSFSVKIDTALGKAGVKGNFSLSKQYNTEASKKMIFEVIF